MTTWKRVTGLVIIAAVLGLIGYDLIVYLFVGNAATLSQVMLGASALHPTLAICFAFGMGVLTTHLFSLDQTQPPTPPG